MQINYGHSTACTLTMKTFASAFQGVKIENFTESWKSGVAFCALIHNFFPQSFDFSKINPENRKQNYEIAFKTGE